MEINMTGICHQCQSDVESADTKSTICDDCIQRIAARKGY